jgi:hypothetical protein
LIGFNCHLLGGDEFSIIPERQWHILQWFDWGPWKLTNHKKCYSDQLSPSWQQKTLINYDNKIFWNMQIISYFFNFMSNNTPLKWFSPMQSTAQKQLLIVSPKSSWSLIHKAHLCVWHRFWKFYLMKYAQFCDKK